MQRARGRRLATQGVGANSVPAIRRETTTYQKNLYDQPDDAYELVTTLATLSALLRRQKHAITTKCPRHNPGIALQPATRRDFKAARSPESILRTYSSELSKNRLQL